MTEGVTSKVVTTKPAALDAFIDAQDLYRRGVTLANGAASLFDRYPSLTPDILAPILAAVWGRVLGFGKPTPKWDTLSTALFVGSNNEWPAPNCDIAAKKACSVWQNFLTRKALGDTGALPYPGTNVTGSPDIICNGSVRATDTQLNLWCTPAGWQTAPWAPLVNGTNYLYLRAKDMSPGRLTGRMAMYQYRNSISIKPSQWQPIRTVSGSYYAQATAETTGDVVINRNDPFQWSTGGVAPEHMCLVGLISTDFLANNPPPDDNFQYAVWLIWNLGAAWHNVDIPRVSGTNVLAFHNLNGQPETYRIEAHCTNLPAGTVVQLSDSATTLDSGAVTVSSASTVISATTVLPGHYEGDVTVSIKTPDGKGLPAGAAVDVKGFWLVGSGHDDFNGAAAYGLLAGAKLEKGDTVPLLMGNFTYVGSFE